jgi:uncharacterized protein YbjQ (UPF0145 family)
MTSHRLPPPARERIEKLSTGAPWSSQQPVGQEAVLRGLGFSAAAVVIGSVYSYGFGFPRPPGYRRAPRLSDVPGPWVDDPISAKRSGAYVHDWAVTPEGKPTGDFGWTWERPLHQERQRKMVDSAFAKLLTEARSVGAHGVVGMNLAFRKLSSNPNISYGVYEVRVHGTAVVVPGLPPSERPFTTGLCGGELLKLAQRGHAPSEFVVGIGGVRGQLGRRTRRRLRSFQNGEIEQFTEVTQMSISIARRDLERQTTNPGDLVVASSPEFEVQRELGSSYDVTTRIAGSIIRKLHRYSTATSLALTPVVPLNDEDW